MANSDLQNKTFECPLEIRNHIKKMINKYGEKTKGYKRANGLLDKKSITYEHLKRIKNFFDTYSGNEKDSEYNIIGGDKMKQWVNKTLDSKRNSLHHVKKVKQETGMDNQFKKTHTKDNNNKNITKIRTPKLHKGSVNHQIYTGKVRYESVDDEITTIKYLIEYLNKDYGTE